MTSKADHFPLKTLERFEEDYLPFFRQQQDAGCASIPVEEIAARFQLDERQVRREMAALTGSGELRREYVVAELIQEISHFLGYDNCRDVALVGAGPLAAGLLANAGFASQDLNLSLVFDPKGEGELAGCRVMPLDHLPDVAARMHLHLGVIATEPDQAQAAAGALAEAGILAIWNISGAHLSLPASILIFEESFGADEDIAHQEAVALSLAALKEAVQKNMGWAQ